VCVCVCVCVCVFSLFVCFFVFLFLCLFVCLFVCLLLSIFFSHFRFFSIRKKYGNLMRSSHREGDGEECGNEGDDDDNEGGSAAGRSGSGKKKRGPADPFQGFREETEDDVPAMEKNEASIDKDREEGVPKVGEKSFLGDSHHGSARHLSKLAMNALTIVSELGRPTFFLTLTCNHMWPEIQCRLFPGQSAFDREDVVDQVWLINLAIPILISIYFLFCVVSGCSLIGF
jgi:Helitron helicase-like domain at N-terminus